MYFTYCKNYLIVALTTGTIIFSGCAHKNTASSALKTPTLSPLEKAQMAYHDGEYYSARTQVQAVLNQDPENTVAQQLMADVLDKEIERQKEAVISTSPDNNDKEVSSSTEEANQTEVKNWLDRSRMLLHQNQYDLALFAAEKVFIYDANNREASFLIDDIKEAAMKSGKADTLFLSKMYQEEIGDRVKKYRSEAKDLMDQDKNEQAKFDLQKILTLEPEDPEALRLLRELQKKEAHA